jgi:DNA-binding GntR family transcriptional regulator
VLRAVSARFSTLKITEADIDRLSEKVDELVALAPEAPTEQLLQVAEAFDEILNRAAENPSLDALIGSAGVFSRGRRLQAIQVLRDRDPKTGLSRIEAHRDVVAALRARDPERVERAVRSQLTASLLLFDHDRTPDRNQHDLRRTSATFPHNAWSPIRLWVFRNISRR